MLIVLGMAVPEGAGLVGLGDRRFMHWYVGNLTQNPKGNGCWLPGGD